MSAIKTENLVHNYRQHLWSRTKHALRGLDLCVEEGEIFGYLGVNGAGKTTTIKILLGLQTATSGTASLFGVPVTDIKARMQVGFQPENPYFYEYLSARESMHFYAGLCDVPRSERKKRVDELLEFVGMTDAADVRVKEYSKGMRQRLGIAQALVHNPKLVILDEPMSGLDPIGRSQVREAIMSLKEKGLTVFFSSHILGDVEMICDRVGLLMDGKLQACGPLESLLNSVDKEVELAVANVSPECEKKLLGLAKSSSQEGEQHFFIFPDWATADKAVAEVNAGGATLRLLHPRKETLEEYFMRSTGKSRAEIGAWSGGSDK